MFYFYLAASAALIPILNIRFHILQEDWSWWLVPLLFVGFFLGFIILHLAAFAISIWAINPNGPADRLSGFYRKFIGLTLPLLFKLVLVRVRTSGLEKVPQNGRFLLVCNHLHDIDPAVILYALPDAELGFIGKKEIYTTMPFVARAMHKLHCLPIDRENNREAVRAIISAVKLIKEDKASIGIFPEGYVSKSGELLPMRNGAFKIAYKADVPVVICSIVNTPQAVKYLFRRRTAIYFDVLDVVPAERLKEIHSGELGELASDLMRESIARRRAELEK